VQATLTSEESIGYHVEQSEDHSNDKSDVRTPGVPSLKNTDVSKPVNVVWPTLVMTPLAVILEPDLTPMVAFIRFIASYTTKLVVGGPGSACASSIRNAIGVTVNNSINSINSIANVINLFFIFLSPFLLQTHLALYDLGVAIVLFQTAYKFCEI
jgi:hypothetical protein